MFLADGISTGSFQIFLPNCSAESSPGQHQRIADRISQTFLANSLHVIVSEMGHCSEDFFFLNLGALMSHLVTSETYLQLALYLQEPA